MWNYCGEGRREYHEVLVDANDTILHVELGYTTWYGSWSTSSRRQMSVKDLIATPERRSFTFYGKSGRMTRASGILEVRRHVENEEEDKKVVAFENA